jgi:hypothetical protein
MESMQLLVGSDNLYPASLADLSLLDNEEIHICKKVESEDLFEMFGGGSTRPIQFVVNDGEIFKKLKVDYKDYRTYNSLKDLSENGCLFLSVKCKLGGEGNSSQQRTIPALERVGI